MAVPLRLVHEVTDNDRLVHTNQPTTTLEPPLPSPRLTNPPLMATELRRRCDALIRMMEKDAKGGSGGGAGAVRWRVVSLLGDGVLFTQGCVWVVPFAREWVARSVVPSPRLDQTSEDVQMPLLRYSMLYCVQLQLYSVHWLNFAVAFPRHQARRRAGARGVTATQWLAVLSCLPQYQVVSNELLKQKHSIERVLLCHDID